jgi:hypothetical protein
MNWEVALIILACLLSGIQMVIGGSGHYILKDLQARIERLENIVMGNGRKYNG